MEAWQTIQFEQNDIVSQTERAYLIQLPSPVAKNLDVEETTSFWFPKKLVKGERGTLIASFPPDFTVNLFHSTRDPETGRYSKKGEEQVSATLLVEQWLDPGLASGPGAVDYGV